MNKKMSEMTRPEWIINYWIDVSTIDMREREFILGRKRTPDEAFLAAREWDVYSEALEEYENENVEEKI